MDDRRPTYLTNLKKRKLQSMVGSNGESDDDDEEELGASVRYPTVFRDNGVELCSRVSWLI